MSGSIDSELVESAYRAHRTDIYKYFLRRTRSAEEAEDLTQRVFLDAAARLSAAEPTNILAWLYRIAQRRFVDHVRARRPETTLSEDIEDTNTHAYGPNVAQAIAAALGRLSHKDQIVVTRKLLEGRRFSEIAAELSMSEAACKMRFSRALQLLRADLDAAGVDR